MPLQVRYKVRAGLLIQGGVTLSVTDIYQLQVLTGMLCFTSLLMLYTRILPCVSIVYTVHDYNLACSVVSQALLLLCQSADTLSIVAY
jgi:hypothetical protein